HGARARALAAADPLGHGARRYGASATPRLCEAGPCAPHWMDVLGGASSGACDDACDDPYRTTLIAVWEKGCESRRGAMPLAFGDDQDLPELHRRRVVCAREWRVLRESES